VAGVEPDPAAPKGALVTSERLAEQTIRLTADDASLTIDPAGGRIVSARILGRDILVSSGPRPIDWGCFPMVPFAGRLRDATLRHGGREWHLPATAAPHAIHGTVATRRWRVDDERTLSIDLGPDWPFRGRVIQRFELQPGRLRVELELQADEPMPGMLGWHPWFRWHLDGAGADASGRAELDVIPGAMFERDAAGIALNRLVPPPPGPWDDCFTRLACPPVVRWPGILELRIESSCPDWVLFTESPRGLCVEPQTGPPDAPNTQPELVEPGSPLRADMCWSWQARSSPP
jgi:aldose 1-epimerase